MRQANYMTNCNVNKEAEVGGGRGNEKMFKCRA